MGVLNTQKQCRCCLGGEKNLTDMFAGLCDDSNIKLIESYFRLIFGKISANEDKKGYFLICGSCNLKLQSSYAFQEMCKKSDEQIQSSFIKEELTAIHLPIYQDDIDDDQAINDLPDIQKVEVKEEAQDMYSDENDNDFDVRGDDSESSIEVKPDLPTKESRVKRKKLKLKSKSKKRMKSKHNDSATDEQVGMIDEMTGVWLDSSTDLKPGKSVADDGEYYCIFCDKHFLNLVNLQYHRRKKHNSKQYRLRKKCLLCSEENLDKYEEHLAECHSEFQPNKCKLCPQTYQNYRDLKTHTNAHVSGNKFKCHGCGLFCKSALFLRTHIANTNHGGVTSGGNFLIKSTYNCPFCGMLFEKIKPLSEHIKSIHLEDLRRKYFPCFHCKQIFLTQERRENDWKDVCSSRKKKADAAHKKQNHIPTFECTDCPRKYYIQDERDCHVIAEHMEAKPRYYCEICDIKFRIARELKKHNNQTHKAITKKQNEIFMCDLCGKFFPSKCLLKRHSIIHDDIRPFECPHEDCSSRFKSRDVLKSHLSTAHVTEKNHECNECGKKFKSRMFIKGHLYSHFPSLRKFVCDHCGERFSSALRRKRHFRSHTGEKIFKCTICDKSYAFRTGLQQHIQSNHTSIRYECKFCDKKLAGKRSMWKHAFVHRGYFPFYCPVCNYGCYPKELMRRHMKNKHQMEYVEKLHGFHKESFDDVIASAIKVNSENAANFRPNQVNLNTDFNYLTYMTIENNATMDDGQNSKPSTSMKIETNNINPPPPAPTQLTTPYIMEYKHEF